MRIPVVSSVLAACRRYTSDPHEDGLQVVLFACGFVIGLFALLAYARTLSYTVTEIPAVLADLLPWKYGDLHPEPWEGALYHIGFTLVMAMTLVVWCILHRFVKPLFATTAQAMRFFSATALVGFIAWIVVFATITVSQSLDYTTLLPLSLFTWPLAGIGAIAFLFRKTLFDFLPHGRWETILEILVIGSFIVWISYDPTSLYSVYPTGASDIEWFTTPAHDVLHGKHLLVESFSQYGLFLFYALSIVFRFFSITQAHFSMIQIGIHIVYFSLLYALLRMIMKNRGEAILAFIVVMGFSYFMNEARFEFYGQPSITRLRNFCDMPVFLCMILELKTNKKLWFRLLCFVAGFAAFYNMDIGISLMLTTFVYAVSVPLFSAQTPKKIARDIVIRCLSFAGGIAFWFGLFNLFIFSQTGSFPHWSRLFAFLSMYSAGFGGLPMPVVGAYWWVVLSYFVSIVTVFVLWVGKRHYRYAPFLLALSLYGLLVFHYYLGRSYIANLWVISAPAALCCCMLFSLYRARFDKRLAHDTLVSRFLSIGILIFACVLIASATTVIVLVGSKMLNDRYLHSLPPPTHTPEYAETFEASVQAITSRIAPGFRAAVFSNRDSLFTLASDRPNAFDYSTMDSVFTRSDLEAILTRFFGQHHQFLFVDRSPINCHMCKALLPLFQQFYTLQTTEGLFDVYVRNEMPDPPVISLSTQ